MYYCHHQRQLIIAYSDFWALVASKAVGAYSAPPDPLAFYLLSKNPFPALGLKFYDFPSTNFWLCSRVS